MTGGGFDLPPIEPIFGAYVARHGLGRSPQLPGGNFFADPLPSADVLVMGHILMTGISTRSACCCRRPMTRCPRAGR